MPSSFFWYDVMTTDTKAAQKFYCDVVGWTAEDMGKFGQDYIVFNTRGQGVAGLMNIPEGAAQHGARPGWMGYIGVDDVDGAAQRLKQEGGQVLRGPIDVPGIIRFAVATDPQGAPFMIAKGLRPQDAPPPLPIGTEGTIGWRELYAGDWKAVFPFYEKMFGWTKADAIDMGPMGTYQLFAAGAQPIGGMMTKPANMPAPPHWGFYINVPAIDAGAARITAGGGKILNGPLEVPGGQWVVNAMDPQGAAFSLVANKR
ncbi:MAG TPA: VOC family protein [Rhizomicrobium sp.]|nr:VOC family protein [Rhizomicrobium sp.]